MFPSFCFICKECRLKAYEKVGYLVQYLPNFIIKTTDAKRAGDKRVWKKKYCYKNHARVTSKLDSSSLHTPMGDFSPDLDSVIDLTEEGVILEHHCVRID